jgi:hypothetical protein
LKRLGYQQQREPPTGRARSSTLVERSAARPLNSLYVASEAEAESANKNGEKTWLATATAPIGSEPGSNLEMNVKGAEGGGSQAITTHERNAEPGDDEEKEKEDANEPTVNSPEKGHSMATAGPETERKRAFDDEEYGLVGCRINREAAEETGRSK